MIWVPRIVYGATTLTLTLPMEVFRPTFHTRGGSRIVDAGAVATYRRRRDRFLPTSIRIWESELNAMVAFIDWCHDNGMGPYTFRLNKDDPGTDYSMYLSKPDLNESWEPAPEPFSQYPGCLVIPITHRRVTDAPFTHHFYS